jgi:hypothetical protein
MNLKELKAAAKASIHLGFGCGDPECRCFGCLVQPPTILKLIAVVEAAQALIDYSDTGGNDKPYPYIYWDDKFKAIELAIKELEK